MAQPGIKELLEAGVHFGHQTRRWNPKMRRFIFGERGGIYIIDLLKTERMLEDAQRFASEVAHRGGTVLFVGTKKQARDAIRDVADRSGMPYVNHRWLGGLLTNFQTISQRIKRLHDLERYEADGQLALLPTRERLAAQADLEKLRANLGGVKDMRGTPSAVFVIDLKTEAIAVREAQRLRIPIIGLVDTNCDPDGIDYVIPGNDDAIRSCAIIANAIGDVVAEGSQVYRAEQERIAAERARREAEERARREEEERRQREAEEAAAAAAVAAESAAGAQESPASAPDAASGQAPAPASAPAAEAAPAARQAQPAPAAQPAKQPAAAQPEAAEQPRPAATQPQPGDTQPERAAQPTEAEAGAERSEANGEPTKPADEQSAASEASEAAEAGVASEASEASEAGEAGVASGSGADEEAK